MDDTCNTNYVGISCAECHKETEGLDAMVIRPDGVLVCADCGSKIDAPTKTQIPSFWHVPPSEGVRFDDGKPRMDLLPGDALIEIAKVFSWGAKKYSQSIGGVFWNVLNPIAIEIHTATGIVGRITRSDSGGLILSSLKDNGRTGVTGRGEIRTKYANWQGAEQAILSLVNETQPLSGEGILESWDSQKHKRTRSYEGAVKFAAASDTYTWITITRPGDSEEYCAVSTTTALGFLVTTFRALKPHLPISSLRPIKGDRNWEKGMDWHKLYAPIQRHLWKWWQGEELDEESGLHHLAHAACDILMLQATVFRNTGTDDRPKGSTAISK